MLGKELRILKLSNIVKSISKIHYKKKKSIGIKSLSKILIIIKTNAPLIFFGIMQVERLLK